MYLNRLIEKNIEQALETSGVVVVAGPKFCGKTTVSKRYAKSSYVLDSKKKIEFAQANPEEVLFGATPRLMDEWQNVADLWNVARTMVDERENHFGQFIFTGSSTPADMDEIYHSGAGRIVTIPMYPMSLTESKESKEIVSLSKMFAGENLHAYINENYSLRDTAFYICRGGWPLSLNENRDTSLRITRNYCDTLFDFENSRNGKFRNKKKEILLMVLKSYARNISTECRKSIMINDVSVHEDRDLDIETFDEYLRALNDLFIIKDIEAWNPNFRSKTSIIATPTRHFVDPSVAAYALGMSVDDLMNDPNTFGLLFEDFVIKELRIYANALDGEVKHYRDSNGLECDAVLHLRNGEYGLIEIKLGGDNLIDEGIRNLRNLESKILQAGKKGPEFKMIITAVGHAYKKDDVSIVPINLLTV